MKKASRKKSKPIPARKRERKNEKKTSDYLLLTIPENPDLFAVQRRTAGDEQFVKKDPLGKELGVVYTGVTYLVSPFFNYDTQRPGESCTCLSWRQRHRRCIHLRKFFEMNPELAGHNIFEDTNLPIDEIIAAVANETLPNPLDENLRKRLIRELGDFTNDWYHNNPEFRKWLEPCLKTNPDPNQRGTAKAKTRLIRVINEWAKSHNFESQIQPTNS